MNRRSLFAAFLAAPAALAAAMRPKVRSVYLASGATHVIPQGTWRIVSCEMSGKRGDFLVREGGDYLGGLSCEEYAFREMKKRCQRYEEASWKRLYEAARMI